VVCEDSLGLGAGLEADMQRLIEGYRCEWKEAIETPEILQRFRHFVNSDAPDAGVVFVAERGQMRPARAEEREPTEPHEAMAVRVCLLEDIVGAGVAALVDGEQVLFRLDDDSIHAVGNRDPFSGANVSRGIVGDLKGELVVASPVYKQHFNLRTGRCLEDAGARIPVYEARVEEGWVVIEPRKHVATTCCYCGVGCGVVVSTHKNGIFSVKGDAAHPANHGRLCTKGAALHLSTDAGARLLYPEVDGERDLEPRWTMPRRGSGRLSRRTARTASRSTSRASC
jgi:NAD(P)H-dependent nitrite reductase small subunit